MPVLSEGERKSGRQMPAALVSAIVAGLLLLFLVLLPRFRAIWVGVPFSPYTFGIYYVSDRRPYAWTPAPPPGFSVQERMIYSFDTRKSYQVRVGDWVGEVGRHYGMGGD